MASSLEELVGKKVSVVCGDGRNLIGILKGYDQVQNLVLSETHERSYSMEAPVELIDLGLYIVRGDNLALIGELGTHPYLHSSLLAPQFFLTHPPPHSQTRPKMRRWTSTRYGPNR
ncbi:hypothetical protein TL16_g08263 [Triparma laevis f. inornata]|uniref:U6 snRNA-associated Sm-like protein LSm8 n=1 Tax=Triparma laevis f. inornata TaxID=1714386 RepID=A0A9W7EI37_9STRA|nr:hypothetical protein TL16_g08263 [Triparma laevis f. inornata]